jgi:hypothetical protein
MQSDDSYVVSFIFEKKARFLLWQDGESAPDRFIVSGDDHELIVAESIKNICVRAEQLNIKLNAQEATVYDLDLLFETIHRLTPNRTLTQLECEQILEVWNVFDDLARSIAKRPDTNVQVNGEDTHAAYEKIFHGNNLPSITLPGDTYLPVLSEHECVAIRDVMKAKWSAVLRSSNIFVR